MFSSLPVRREDNHLLGGGPAYGRTGAVVARFQISPRRAPGGLFPGVVSLARVVEFALFRFSFKCMPVINTAKSLPWSR